MNRNHLNTQSTYKTPPQNLPISWSFSRSDCNGKEKDWESGFHYYGARYYWSEMLTGWLSVDPMSDKYPSLSPYAYCAWNPVKLVDPDGEGIYYKEDKNVFEYKKNTDGKYGFYNCGTGEAYSGDNQQFVNDLTKALGQLKEGKYGNQLVSFFEGSQGYHVIINNGDENYQDGTKISWNNTDKTPIPVGATPKDPVQVELAETFVCLGHELAHARDAYKFGENFNNMTLEVKERRAMFTENLIRKEHGLRQRTYYGLKDNGYSVDYDSYQAIVLPSISVGVNRFVNSLNN